jgi:hypothetical protein
MLKKLVTSTPNFITAAELKEAAALQLRCAHAQNHLGRYEYRSREARFQEAAAVYIKSPTDENIAAMEKAFLERNTFGGVALVARDFLPVLKAALDALLGDEVLAWLQPIWQRAYDLAGANLKRITEEESKRIFVATGSPMTASDLVLAAKAAVQELAELGERCVFGQPYRGVGSLPGGALNPPIVWLEFFGYGLKGAL